MPESRSLMLTLRKVLCKSRLNENLLSGRYKYMLEDLKNIQHAKEVAHNNESNSEACASRLLSPIGIMKIAMFTPITVPKNSNRQAL